MKIVIAGAGEVGTHLAKMLSQENQDIILMDPNEERLNISRNNMEVLPMVGNPTSLRDLEEAGIRKADLFVSVTPEETTNIAACLLAHNLGAHRTLARINNYEYLLPKNMDPSVLRAVWRCLDLDRGEGERELSPLRTNVG